MSYARRESRVAYLEEAEEDTGSSLEAVEGTRQYATTDEPPTPSKQRPNTSKSREKRPSAKKSHPSSTSASSAASESPGRSATKGKTASKSSQKDIEREQREREQRRRDRRLREEEDARRERAAAKAAKEAKEAKANRKTRPSVKHAATQPVVQLAARREPSADNPSYYGQQPAASAAYHHSRQRPASYYGQNPVHRPPLTNMGWYQTHQPHAPFPVGTFPPPHGFAGPPHAMPFSGPPSPTGAPGHFEYPGSQDRLRQRFGSRPSSSMGFHGPAGPDYPHDEYEEVAARIPRRSSHSRQRDEDRQRMPPPALRPIRTKSAMPASGPFRPPLAQPAPRVMRSPTTNRRSVEFVEPGYYDDEDYLGEHALFQDASPKPSYEVRETAMTRPRRGSVSYERQDYDLVPASRSHRRSSMYGTGALGLGGVSLRDDKLRDAMRYQQDVAGPPQPPLTKELLRKASRRGEGASSRSTRSSASRDESDYKRSNTTGITRSSSVSNDDLTIKVSGSAVVRIQGTEIECNDGGEITVSSRPTDSRSGSERGNAPYQIEDSRSRIERTAPPQRTRDPSQSDSQSRGYASYRPYDTGYATGGYI